jgi:hypothetical protein
MQRVIAVGLGTALLGFAAWLSVSNLRRDQLDSWIFWLPIALWLLAMGLLCWWAVLAGRQPRTSARIRASWRMGWILGAAGLVLGYIGPLVMRPGGNFGPLLGILITGPLGFTLGALGAVLTGAIRNPGDAPSSAR